MHVQMDLNVWRTTCPDRSLVHWHSRGHAVPPLTGSTLRDLRLFLGPHAPVGEGERSATTRAEMPPSAASPSSEHEGEEMDSMSLFTGARGGAHSERDIATANLAAVFTIAIAVYHCA